MPQVRVGWARLKGPAGSVSTDKRVIATRVNMHGPIDKRVIVDKVTLNAPPPNSRVRITNVRLVGPNSPLKPVYIGTASGWQAVDVYVPNSAGTAWVKIA